MKQHCIAVFGGDARQAHAAQIFLAAGWQVQLWDVPEIEGLQGEKTSDSFAQAIKDADIVLGPVPFKDYISTEELIELLQPGQIFIAGMLPKLLCETLKQAGVACYDLLLRQDFAVLNAISTAEGAIAEAISASGGNLHLCPVLVLGYGRCAKPLIKKLQGLQAHVTVATRNWDDACAAIANGCEVIDFTTMPFHLPRFGYIFNTVPAKIIDENMLQGISPEATIIDIASAPGGVDIEAAKRMGRNAHLCPSLPGKYAPRSSGECIAQTVRIILDEREGHAWGRKPKSASD
ncbi:MAG: dipicolinate synthase subunit DpsA [Oscillospiraceae bacterium]|nr:dipicolinate synthase subunit DpsA [Oscillospiraceae bacterium]